MNRVLTVLFFTVFSFLASENSPVIANSPLVEGGRLPVINLPVPQNPDDRLYLGISGMGNFRIHQIKAEAVIIQIVNQYCPPCQTAVDEMVELYRRIESNPGLHGKMKLIGIGAGNSSREVEVLREAHHLPFPIFPDEDFIIHKALGEVRTPYTIAVRIGPGSAYKVVYSQPGGFTDTDRFLKLMLTTCGFKKDDSSGEKGDFEASLAQ